MNGIFLTYLDLICLVFGIGMLWFMAIWGLLWILDSWGLLPDDWK
jgi:hypothetical protein